MKRKQRDEHDGEHGGADGFGGADRLSGADKVGGADIPVRLVRHSSDPASHSNGPIAQANNNRDEGQALGEGWAAFAQLLEAATPPVDHARLISAVTHRVERRRFERRAERMALAASLLLMASLAWVVGRGERPAPIAHDPRAGADAGARVAAAADAAHGETKESASREASRLAWDDGLDPSFELAWQQVSAASIDRVESDPFVELHDALHEFEVRLEAEAL